MKVRGIGRPLGLSRNKVVVGEPVAGQFIVFSDSVFYYIQKNVSVYILFTALRDNIIYDYNFSCFAFSFLPFPVFSF